MNENDTFDGWVHQVVGTYARPLAQYARQLLNNDDRARDVVQETFVTLCRQRRDELEPRLKPWLYTVCRNKALDVLRKEGRTDFMEDPPDLPADHPPEPHPATDNLLSALALLPDRQRDVIRLKFLHGMSYRDISQATSLSESNVGFLIHTGLKTLRRHLNPHSLPSS
jgi:RNA polymerase sigma factor (sigma-70 family)